VGFYVKLQRLCVLCGVDAFGKCLPALRFKRGGAEVEGMRGVEAFSEFYEAETKHRKLTWVYTQPGFLPRHKSDVWCGIAGTFAA
jgi:hypothetical protein